MFFSYTEEGAQKAMLKPKKRNKSAKNRKSINT
jgi:hypothetical protein